MAKLKKEQKKRPVIPTEVKTKLWLKSCGRCEFEGCNIPLWTDNLTYREMNISYIAHIYGYAEGSARYDAIKSPLLEKEFENLMLLCDVHHRMIDDKKNEEEYNSLRLIQMKKHHEETMIFLTGLTSNKRSHIVLFGAKIGLHDSPLQFNRAALAMKPNYYPATPSPIELGLKNSSFEDSKDNYWDIQLENLEVLFSQRLGNLKANHDVQHFSIFALAPQPLLIKFGTLLSDIYEAEIYQLHREPYTWGWVDDDTTIHHKLLEFEKYGNNIVLKFELSATIINTRITAVLGEDCSIWSITHDNPLNNDYIRNRDNIADFRKTMRKAFDTIKAKHGQNVVLHIFPAMPVSIAVELGRVWMPKADLPMVIYDQNNKLDGFYKTITINH